MLRTTAALLVVGFLLAPEQTFAQDDVARGVTVEGAIALGVEDRQPIDVATGFSADVGTVYAWTSISGAAETTIQHVWRHADHEFSIDIAVGGSPWRVWTTKAIPEEWTGEWTFEVVSADGEVVYTTSFTVGSS